MRNLIFSKSKKTNFVPLKNPKTFKTSFLKKFLPHSSLRNQSFCEFNYGRGRSHLDESLTSNFRSNGHSNQKLWQKIFSDQIFPAKFFAIISINFSTHEDGSALKNFSPQIARKWSDYHIFKNSKIYLLEALHTKYKGFTYWAKFWFWRFLRSQPDQVRSI